MSDCRIEPINPSDEQWAEAVDQAWGHEFIVSRGKEIYPRDTEGLIALDSFGDAVGLLTYRVDGQSCEIVSVDAFERWRGIGTALLERVKGVLREREVSRVWLVTTNDNVDAMRFYQKRGFTLAAAHVNALAYSRELKPQIPMTGSYGIPMRDEVIFECWL